MNFLLLTLFACTEYSFNSHPGASEGSNEEKTWMDTEGLTDETPTEETDDYSNSLRGRVCNPSGEGWIVDARVYVEIDDDGDGIIDREVEDYTDSEGRYELLNLPLGEIVVEVEKGSFGSSLEVYFPGGTYEIPEVFCPLDPPSIAVIEGHYDHIEGILSQMGVNYTLFHHDNSHALISDPQKMAEFDVIFINCALHSNFLLNNRQLINTNITNYIAAGGSIYASDWAYPFIEFAFPEKLDFYGDDMALGAHVGLGGTFQVDILDPTMQAILESNTSSIHYDLGEWIVLEDAADDVDVMVSGTVNISHMGNFQTLVDVPLVTQFTHGLGRVIYTTFHNEHQGTSLNIQALLEEMILNL